MLMVEFPAHVLQLVLMIRELLCRHRFGIYPAPDRMRISATLLFMEDNRARLAIKAQLNLSVIYGAFKTLAGDLFILGGIERERKQEMLTLRPARERIADMSAHASLISRTVSGLSGNAPSFAAWANSLRLGPSPDEPSAANICARRR